MSSSLPLSDAVLPGYLPDRDPADAAAVDFLRLQLVSGMPALLSTQHIGSVLTLKMSQITPVSHMPDWVIGAYNWRGVILWMIDAGHLCGLTPWYQQVSHQSVHPAVVLQIRDRGSAPGRAKDQTLGLIVHQVENIESCELAAIEWFYSATSPARHPSFWQGYWGNAHNDKIPILDGAAILAAMPRS